MLPLAQLKVKGMLPLVAVFCVAEQRFFMALNKSSSQVMLTFQAQKSAIRKLIFKDRCMQLK